MNLKAALIQLPRRSDSCQKCQARFERGNDYYSLLIGDDLVASKNPTLVRQDFCLSCWQLSSKENTDIPSGSYWKSTIPQRKSTPLTAQLKREESALHLLKSAMHANKSQNDLTDVEVFFLALYLARRRTLTFRHEIDQGGTPFQLFEITETEELLALKKVNFDQVDLHILQKTLALKLEAVPN